MNDTPEAILRQDADNPMPEHRMAGYLDMPDTMRIRYALFRAIKRPNRGCVIILQGRNEAIEKYGETIGDLLARGFDVAAFDWRGQGGSTRYWRDGRRGHVDSYDQYLDDFDQVFTRAVLPEMRAPFFILAHSTGALIALLGAPVLANRIRRMVLCAPFLGLAPEGPGEASLRAFTAALCHLGLARAYMGGGPAGQAALDLATNKLTTDPVRFARNRRLLDPANGLGLGASTAGWLHASLDAIRRVHDQDHMARIHIPILIAAAGADRVVNTAVTEDFARRIRSGARIVIPGARHEILQEADLYREQFLAAFDAFVPGSPA